MKKRSRSLLDLLTLRWWGNPMFFLPCLCNLILRSAWNPNRKSSLQEQLESYFKFNGSVLHWDPQRALWLPALRAAVPGVSDTWFPWASLEALTIGLCSVRDKPYYVARHSPGTSGLSNTLSLQHQEPHHFACSPSLSLERALGRVILFSWILWLSPWELPGLGWQWRERQAVCFFVKIFLPSFISLRKAFSWTSSCEELVFLNWLKQFDEYMEIVSFVLSQLFFSKILLGLDKK